MYRLSFQGSKATVQPATPAYGPYLATAACFAPTGTVPARRSCRNELAHRGAVSLLRPGDQHLNQTE